MALALVFLGGVLWRVQVLKTGDYRSNLDRQSMRRVRLPGIRGRILDRHGECLADNRASYCIAIYIEEMRQAGRRGRTIDRVEAVIDELAAIVRRPRTVSRKDILMHVNRRLPLPFVAWRDLDHASIARLAESKKVFAGVDIQVEPVRVYPHEGLALHLLGYVGRADPGDEDERPYHYYLPEMEGRAGIERVMDDRLRGTSGGRLIRVDASGFKYEEQGERDPHDGEDIHLAIDRRIQEAAETSLGELRGAAVVLDPRNGDVLALASSPCFDRTALQSKSEWSRVLNHAGRPLINRAIAGEYPPGSILKPLVGIVGLMSGVLSPTDPYTCDGHYEIGRRSVKCWSTRGHGAVSIRKAIEQSCNPFFCNAGALCGLPRIWHMGDAVGLGRRTGIELRGEARGLLPDDDWKRRARGEGWRGGDTCNLSIGQGFVLVTPIQMAMFAAALGNGGKIYRPRLVLDESKDGELVNQLAWPARHLEVIRGGMYDVVQAESGTGKRVRIDHVAMAAKTGTAQYGKGKKHGWMILFAPYDSPRYAVAMIVEDAVSGGITVAPRMKQLMESILTMDGTIDRPQGTEEGHI